MPLQVRIPKHPTWENLDLSRPQHLPRIALNPHVRVRKKILPWEKQLPYFLFNKATLKHSLSKLHYHVSQDLHCLCRIAPDHECKHAASGYGGILAHIQERALEGRWNSSNNCPTITCNFFFNQKQYQSLCPVSKNFHLLVWAWFPRHILSLHTLVDFCIECLASICLGWGNFCHITQFT